MKRFILPTIAVLVITGAALATCCGAFGDSDSTESEQRFNEGIDAQEAGRLEEAVTLYTEAIELDPELTEAYGNRSLAYLDLGASMRHWTTRRMPSISSLRM